MGSLAPYDLGNQLSARILSAARSVHQYLGPGYPEETYRKAIVNELRRQHLEVQRLFPVDVWQSAELAELYFLDLFVEWQVIVEIKATRGPLIDEIYENMMAYLDAAEAPLGLLLNFGRRRLEYERIFPARPMSGRQSWLARYGDFNEEQ